MDNRYKKFQCSALAFSLGSNIFQSARAEFWFHCNPVQGQYRARTGFSLCTFPTQGKPWFHYRVPRWWKQVFPCEKKYTGKSLFSLQGWVCSVSCRDLDRRDWVTYLLVLATCRLPVSRYSLQHSASAKCENATSVIHCWKLQNRSHIKSLIKQEAYFLRKRDVCAF